MRWTSHSLLLSVVLTTALGGTASAGGAWVPAPGDGYVSLGYSQKTASSSWDAYGTPFDDHNKAATDTGTDLRKYTGPLSIHNFNYALLSGETGLFKYVSVTYLFTYLYGIEGAGPQWVTPSSPTVLSGAQHVGIGFSDAWLGAKFAFNNLIHLPDWPLALGFTARVPWFYQQPGNYSTYLYSGTCTPTVNPKTGVTTLSGCTKQGTSSDWLGVYWYDFTPALLASKSLPRDYGWVNAEFDFVIRTHAPADAVAFDVNAGVRLPMHIKPRFYIKFDMYGNFSVHNEGPGLANDRFAFLPTCPQNAQTNLTKCSVYNFNDASMLKVYGALFVQPWKGLFLEAGFGKWVWGESARQYQEVYAGAGWTY